jgi:thymidylate synthase
MRYRNASEAMLAKIGQLLLLGGDVVVRGSETRELMHQLVSLDKPMERCIVVPERKNNVFASIAETMWVMAGRNDVAYLSNYLPRAVDFSDDGDVWRAGYGPRLRQWHGTDQFASVLRTLSTSPSSRRAAISLFDPTLDSADGADIPCTNWLHFIVRDGHLALNIAVRSNDIMWGFSGINTFEWSVIQEMMAFWLNAEVGPINYFISSLHLYERHFDRAAQMMSSPPPRSPYADHPARSRFATPFNELDQTFRRWFRLEGAIREGAAIAEEIEDFSDPLFRDFLRMLSAYWDFVRGNEKDAARSLTAVEDRALAIAGADYFAWRTPVKAPAPAHPQAPQITEIDIRRWLKELHRTKSLAYGDSWKRRGEQISIMANIARKVDRLALYNPGASTSDENIIDTAADLLVYTLKYETYLKDRDGESIRSALTWSDGTAGFDYIIDQLECETIAPDHVTSTNTVLRTFEKLEGTFTPDTGPSSRQHLVRSLAIQSLELLKFHLDKNPVAAYRIMAVAD